MPDFLPVPSVPLVGVAQWQGDLLRSLAGNVAILTGQHTSDQGAAITSDRFADMKPLRGVGYDVRARGHVNALPSGAAVPDASDYVTLTQDVQRLAKEVQDLRSVLDSVIKQLKG